MTNFGRNFVFLWKINCLALFNVFIFLFFYKCPVGTSAYQKLLLLNKCPRALNRSKIRSILKNCVELLIKHSCRGLFLIKLYRPLPETLLETDCLPVSLKKPSRAVFFFFFLLESIWLHLLEYRTKNLKKRYTYEDEAFCKNS